MSNEVNQSSINPFGIALCIGPSAIGAAKTVLKNSKGATLKTGFQKSVQDLEIENFKNLGIKLRSEGTDFLSSGFAIQKNQDSLKGLSKAATKAVNKAAKHPKNIKLQNIATEAQTKLTAAKEKLANGQSLVDVKKVGFAENVKNSFHESFVSPISIGLTALMTIPEIKSKVIPAFKEKGVGEGLKESGKLLLKTASSYCSFAFAGAVTNLASAALTAVNPILGIGARLVGSVATMAFSSKVDKLTNKIVGDDEENTQEQQIAQTNQQPQAQQTTNQQYAQYQQQYPQYQQVAQNPYMYQQYPQQNMFYNQQMPMQLRGTAQGVRLQGYQA